MRGNCRDGDDRRGHVNGVLRRVGATISLVLLLTASSACASPTAAPDSGAQTGLPPPYPSASAIPSTWLDPAKVDCQAIAHLAPAPAAKALAAVGFTVNWRLQHTLADGSTAADIVMATPEGAIVDIILNGSVAIVFVAPPGDPAGDAPPPPTC